MDVARVARALGDSTRLQILSFIVQNSAPKCECSYPQEYGVCVCHITDYLKITQPRASYHLKILKDAGVVRERPVGKWAFHSVNKDQLTLFCRELDSLCSEQGEQEEVVE